MSFSNQNLKSTKYECDGVVTDFVADFYSNSPDWIRVLLVDNDGGETDLVVDSDYTVTTPLSEFPTENFNVKTSEAYSSDFSILIIRDIPSNQETDYGIQGNYLPENHERSFDKNMQKIMELEEEVDRCVKDKASREGDSIVDSGEYIEACEEAAAAAIEAAEIATGAVNGIVNQQYSEVATEGQTSFTADFSFPIDEKALTVNLNGIAQEFSTYTITYPSTITLGGAAQEDDVFEVRSGSFSNTSNGVGEFDSIRVSDGSAESPSYTFTDDTNTGLYREDDGSFSVSSNGTRVTNFSDAGVEVNNGNLILTEQDAPQLWLRSTTVDAANAGEIFFSEENTNYGWYIRHKSQNIPSPADRLEFINKNGGPEKIVYWYSNDRVVFEDDVQVRVPDGTLAEPGIALNNNTDTGFYSTGADIRVAIDGNRRADISESGLLLDSGVRVNEFSDDVTLGDSSTSAVPTENAVKEYVDNAIDLLSRSSGIISGFDITVTGVDTIDIGAGKYLIEDATDPENPIALELEYAGTTGYVITAATVTKGFTTLQIDATGTVIQNVNNIETREQIRTAPKFGSIVHTSALGIEQAIDVQTIVQNPNSRLTQFMYEVGTIKDGFAVSAASTDLSITVASGDFIYPGINSANTLNPDASSYAAQDPVTTLLVVKQDEIISTEVDAGGVQIDVANYDNDGTVTAIGGGVGSCTINRIYQSAGLIVFQYGQNAYTSTNDAIAALFNGQDSFIQNPLLDDTSVLCGYIIATRTETDLNNAEFYQTNRFGDVGSSTVAAQLVDLQTAYENGTQPHITTDGTRGLFSILDGTGDNSTIIFAVANSVGSTTLNASGNGIALSAGTRVNEFSTDGTLAGASDDAVPTEQAVKSYVDSHASSNGSSHTFINQDVTTTADPEFASVGLGTTPSTPVHILQDSDDALRFERAGRDTYDLSTTSIGLRFYNVTNGSIDMVFNPDGSVSVGSFGTVAGERFRVNGAIRAEDFIDGNIMPRELIADDETGVAYELSDGDDIYGLIVDNTLTVPTGLSVNKQFVVFNSGASDVAITTTGWTNVKSDSSGTDIPAGGCRTIWVSSSDTIWIN